MSEIPRELIPLRDARSLFPTNPAMKTLVRWARFGLANGARLQVWVIGGRRFTTSEAVERFIHETATMGAA